MPAQSNYEGQNDTGMWVIIGYSTTNISLLNILVWDIKDWFVHTCTSMAGCVLLLSALYNCRIVCQVMDTYTVAHRFVLSCSLT